MRLAVVERCIFRRKGTNSNRTSAECQSSEAQLSKRIMFKLFDGEEQV